MAASGAGLPPPNPSSHPPACSAAQGAFLSQLPPPPPMAQPGRSVRSWGVLRGMCQQPGVKGTRVMTEFPRTVLNKAESLQKAQ